MMVRMCYLYINTSDMIGGIWMAITQSHKEIVRLHEKIREIDRNNPFLADYERSLKAKEKQQPKPVAKKDWYEKTLPYMLIAICILVAYIIYSAIAHTI